MRGARRWRGGQGRAGAQAPPPLSLASQPAAAAEEGGSRGAVGARRRHDSLPAWFLLGMPPLLLLPPQQLPASDTLGHLPSPAPPPLLFAPSVPPSLRPRLLSVTLPPSLQVCTSDGTVFDIVNAVPYIRKFKRHPVSGEALELKDLVR